MRLAVGSQNNVGAGVGLLLLTMRVTLPAAQLNKQVAPR
jgi:hypothetical protein